MTRGLGEDREELARVMSGICSKLEATISVAYRTNEKFEFKNVPLIARDSSNYAGW